MPNTRPIYEQKDPISHILHRPDMYVGSIKIQQFYNEWIYKNNKIIQKSSVRYPDGLKRIFIEPISNAVDNVWRSQEAGVSCKKIMINIDKKTGETSVWNDGLTIPIERSKQNIWNPELIFGNLRTSSNYNDNEKRYTSGRNGLGVKLTNIFSTQFKIETYDTVTGLLYSQEWSNNMKTVSKPSIRKKKMKRGYTKVSWIPDFEKFKLKNYTRDIIGLFHKYVVDIAMITQIPVILNDTKLPVKSLKDYGKLYSNETVNSLVIKTDDCEVMFMENELNEFQAIAFTNGVINKEGGCHVSAWSDAIFKPLLQKFNKKDKPNVNTKDLKQYFRLIINCKVPNPVFSDQSKRKLVSPNIKATVLPKHIKTIMKWGFVKKVQDIIRGKELVSLKKTETRKRFKRIEGLDRANNAGGKHSNDCTLILCEGLSAKTFAVVGVSVGITIDKKEYKGRDWIGIYALKGKLLNVRNASVKKITGNKEIVDIIQICGFQQNKDYTKEDAFKSLNYGRVLIIADADQDGTHIASLILNNIHTLYPSLLKREKPFLYSMKTPIIKLKYNRKEHIFYQEELYRRFVEKLDITKLSIKYYKGLGTSTDKEIKECFGKKMVYFVNDEKSQQNMVKVFDKTQSDSRKTWLSEYDAKDTVINLNNHINPLTITDFLNKRLRSFSVYDCERSIPNIIDGLKTSQRKILFAIIKKGLTSQSKPMKVAQLGGYVAEQTNYHHGEQCLFDTIIKLAQSFVGSNNIPYLEEKGQFGCRNNGGKDAASARYIYTRAHPILSKIYRKEDESILNYQYDDGQKIEPLFFLPIIPMILVNGCKGIGSGWSTNIPNHNPVDIVNYILNWLSSDKKNNQTNISLSPHYNKFTGRMVKVDEHTYTSYGTFTEEKKNIVITELPVGEWTDTYKNKLETMIENKQIKRIKNYSTKHKVKFVVKTDKKMNSKKLKLEKIIKTSNLVLFNQECRITKYDTISSILTYFCKIRLQYYEKRKNALLVIYKKELQFKQNKKRFLEMVGERKINLYNISEKDLIQKLKECKFDTVKNSYDYLLNLNVRSFTQIKKLSKDINDLIQSIKSLQDKSSKQLWKQDLTEFLVAYKKYITV